MNKLSKDEVEELAAKDQIVYFDRSASVLYWIAPANRLKSKTITASTYEDKGKIELFLTRLSNKFWDFIGGLRNTSNKNE